MKTRSRIFLVLSILSLISYNTYSMQSNKKRKADEICAKSLTKKRKKTPIVKGMMLRSSEKVCMDILKSDIEKVQNMQDLYRKLYEYKMIIENYEEHLLEKLHIFEEAIQCAIQGMQVNNERILWEVLQLWEALFEKNRGFEQAINIAQYGIQSVFGKVREAALALWELLFQNGYGFEQALNAVDQGMKNELDVDMHIVSLRLLQILVKEEKIIIKEEWIKQIKKRAQEQWGENIYIKNEVRWVNIYCIKKRRKNIVE